MQFHHPIGLFTLLVMAVPVPAGAHPRLEAAFSNTIVSTYPDGRIGKLWLEPDGSYSGLGRRGDSSSGRWKVKGERICFRQSRPIPIPFSHCAPMVDGDVGAVWGGKAVTGEPLAITLVAGR